MSHLTDTPDLMLEVIAAFVKRSGGYVTMGKDDAIGPFNLLSKIDETGTLHLMLDEDITHEQVDLLNS